MNEVNQVPNRVLLVTEGDQTIGQGICEEAARQGWSVAVHSRANAAGAERVAARIEELGGRAVPIVGELRSLEEARDVIGTAQRRLGPILGLVADGGIAPVEPPLDASEAGWHETINRNLHSLFVTIQALLPAMMEAQFGRIVVLSSMAAQTGGDISAAYAASKAGADGMMRYYAKQLLPHRITANAISVAIIENEVTRKLIPTTDHLPLGRMGSVAELAATCTMLLGNGYMTGQILHLNGGLHFA